MTYELWDASTISRLGSYGSLDGALRVAREIVELNGPELAEDLYVEAVEGTEATVVLDGPEMRRALIDGRRGRIPV